MLSLLQVTHTKLLRKEQRHIRTDTKLESKQYTLKSTEESKHVEEKGKKKKLLETRRGAPTPSPQNA